MTAYANKVENGASWILMEPPYAPPSSQRYPHRHPRRRLRAAQGLADARSCRAQISALLAGGKFPTARVAPPRQEAYGALVTHVCDPAGVLLPLAQWNA